MTCGRPLGHYGSEIKDMAEQFKDAARRAAESRQGCLRRSAERPACMRLLVVGGGAREHALAHAFATDDPSHQIYVAPGNPGTAPFATNLPIAADDIDRIADAADAHAIDLMVVGPEVPLALGLADRIRVPKGGKCFGPGAAGAQIEASKAFAKEVMASRRRPDSREQHL